MSERRLKELRARMDVIIEFLDTIGHVKTENDLIEEIVEEKDPERVFLLRAIYRMKYKEDENE